MDQLTKVHVLGLWKEAYVTWGKCENSTYTEELFEHAALEV